MPVIHVMAAHGELAKGSGPFLFVWTLHAFGVTGMFSLILSVRTVEFAGTTTKLPKRPTGKNVLEKLKRVEKLSKRVREQLARVPSASN